MIVDVILRNARVVTLDPGRPTAGAIGLTDGRIVGLDEELDGARPLVEVDAWGATVIPGFHDAHCHTTSYGLQLELLDLSETHGIDDVLAAVDERARALPEGEWVVGMGYGQGLAPDRHPTRHELDAVSHGHPVWLTHLSGHDGAVSTAVLAAAGIGHGTPDPSGGRIERDGGGAATGVLHENAMDLVKAVVGPSSVEGLARAIGRAGRVYLSEGITAFTEAGVGCPGIDHSPVEVAAYQLARDTGRLHTRAQLMVWSERFHPLDAHPDDGFDRGLDLGIRSGLGDRWLDLGAMKIWIDGTGLDEPGAPDGSDRGGADGGGADRGWADRDWADRGWADDPDRLRAQIVAGHRAGWQVAAHAMGDRAVDLVLDALAEAQAALPRPAARHRIEHCALVRPDQLARMAQLGVTAVPQPVFLAEFGDLFRRVLSDDRRPSAFRLGSFVAAGVPVAASSDRPVVPGAPLRGVQAMVERLTSRGRLLGADERVGAGLALEAYTRGGARAAHHDDRLGVLRRGFDADLAVLADDPTTVDPAEIASIGVLATVVDGRPAHDPGGLLGRWGEVRPA